MLNSTLIRPRHAAWRSARSAPAPRTEPRSKPEVCLHPDPVQFATRQLGLKPDANQQWLLAGEHHRVIDSCSRQWGNSTSGAAKALHIALTRPGSLILIASRTERQSGLLVRKVAAFAPHLGIGRRHDRGHARSVLRSTGLPRGSGENIRVFSAATLLVIDEGSGVTGELYYFARPIPAVSGQHIWPLSTPSGKHGSFYTSAPTTQSVGKDCPSAPRKAPGSPRTTSKKSAARWARIRSGRNTCANSPALTGPSSPVTGLTAFTNTVPLLGTGLRLPTGHSPLNTSFHIGADLRQSTISQPLPSAKPVTWPPELPPSIGHSQTAYELRDLERISLGTPYPEIVERIAVISRRFGTFVYPQIGAAH